MQILSVEEATRQWLRREYFKAALTGLLARAGDLSAILPFTQVIEDAWNAADEAVKQEDEAVKQEQEPE